MARIFKSFKNYDSAHSTVSVVPGSTSSDDEDDPGYKKPKDQNASRQQKKRASQYGSASSIFGLLSRRMPFSSSKRSNTKDLDKDFGKTDSVKSGVQWFLEAVAESHSIQHLKKEAVAKFAGDNASSAEYLAHAQYFNMLRDAIVMDGWRIAEAHFLGMKKSADELMEQARSIEKRCHQMQSASMREMITLKDKLRQLPQGTDEALEMTFVKPFDNLDESTQALANLCVEETLKTIIADARFHRGGLWDLMRGRHEDYESEQQKEQLKESLRETSIQRKRAADLEEENLDLHTKIHKLEDYCKKHAHQIALMEKESRAAPSFVEVEPDWAKSGPETSIFAGRTHHLAELSEQEVQQAWQQVCTIDQQSAEDNIVHQNHGVTLDDLHKDTLSRSGDKLVHQNLGATVDDLQPNTLPRPGATTNDETNLAHAWDDSSGHVDQQTEQVVDNSTEECQDTDICFEATDFRTTSAKSLKAAVRENSTSQDNVDVQPEELPNTADSIPDEAERVSTIFRVLESLNKEVDCEVLDNLKAACPQDVRESAAMRILVKRIAALHSECATLRQLCTQCMTTMKEVEAKNPKPAVQLKVPVVERRSIGAPKEPPGCVGDTVAGLLHKEENQLLACFVDARETGAEVRRMAHQVGQDSAEDISSQVHDIKSPSRRQATNHLSVQSEVPTDAPVSRRNSSNSPASRPITPLAEGPLAGFGALRARPSRATLKLSSHRASVNRSRSPSRNAPPYHDSTSPPKKDVPSTPSNRCPKLGAGDLMITSHPVQHPKSMPSPQAYDLPAIGKTVNMSQSLRKKSSKIA